MRSLFSLHEAWPDNYHFGDLSENVPYGLIGSDTIGKCDLAGVDVALWEEVCHWGQTLGFQKPVTPPLTPAAC